jgi:hypothetical protein
MKTKHILLPALCLLALAQPLSAQQNFNLYHLGKAPQRNLLNPAIHGESKAFFGVPALNSVYFHFSNSGFNLNNVFDALEPSGQGDSTAININKLTDVFSKQNFISMRLEQQWLYAGFSVGKHRFTGHVSDKLAFRFAYPRDLFSFLIDGNGGDNLGRNFGFNFGLSARHYRETGIGYSYQWKDHITLGARVKFLRGLSIVEAAPLNLSITTRPEDYAWQLQSDIRIQTASSLFPLLPADSNAHYEFNAERLYRRNNNRGLGFDLGANVRLSEKLEVSASVIDLGFIRWKENTVTMASRNPNAIFTFNGVHVSSADTSNDVEQYFRNLGDSLLSTFRLDTTRGNAFTTALDGQFFLGGQYQLSERAKVNALVYGDFYNRRFYPGLTLGLYWKPFRFADVHITNTMYNRVWFNPGLGFSTRIGPVQGYFTSDNLFAPLLLSSSRGFSFRFGMNLVFGPSDKKEKNEKKTREKLRGGNVME